MAFATIKRWLRDTSVRPAQRSRRILVDLGLDRLDDRIVPSASLFNLDSSYQGAANASATILGQSANGRYVIFESTATDLVTGQQDIPGTNDLFWRDLLTGITYMVTSLPTISATGYQDNEINPESFALQSVVDGTPILPSFHEAVISNDGQYVAFSSVINASRLDQDFANQNYAPGLSTSTTVYDLNDTLDVFRWSAKTGIIQLASETVANPNDNNTVVAFGRYGSADDPAISSDGSVVGYVSSVAAWYTSAAGQPNGFANNIIIDDGNTPDVFASTFNLNEGGLLATVTPSLLSGNTTTIQEETLTYVGSGGNGGTVTPTFTSYQVTRTYGQASGIGVSVDSEGRYLSVDTADDIYAVFTAPVDPTAPFGFTSQDFSISNTTGDDVTSNGQSEAWRSQTIIGLTELTSQLITNNGTISGTTQGVTTSGGTAQNIIIASTNPNAMIVSTSVGVSTGNYKPAPQGANVNRQDLYYVSILNNARTITKLNGSYTLAPISQANPAIIDTTQYTLTPNGLYLVYTVVTGTQSSGADITQVYYRSVSQSVASAAVLVSVGLDGNPLSLGASSPDVSQNGRYVTFSSATPANLVVSSTITDSNNADDAFIRDLFNSTSVSGAFVGKTELLSIDSAGDATGNAASGTVSGGSPNLIFVGTDFEDPQNGTSPSTSADSLGYVVFNSLATNLDAGYTLTSGDIGTFVDTLPIGGVPPTLPPTTASSEAAVTGGGGNTSSGVQLITYSGDGTVTLGQQFTPFPGFTGELRVAQADVNGDGILDTIVAPGPGGGPEVKIYDGATDKVIFDQFVYESSFTGGVYVAAGDFSGNGDADLVVGAGQGGGARVRVIDVQDDKTLADFFAYEQSFRGGVRVAVGDLNGDGVPDVVTGAGEGGGPRVSAFDGASIVKNGTLDRFVDFFAMDLNLRNGVNIAVGDMNNDGVDDIVVGAGAGGAPRVTVFETQSVIARPNSPTKLYDFFAGPTTNRDGIRVAVKNVDGDATADIVTGAGVGEESRIQAFAGGILSNSLTPTEINDSFVVFNDLNSINGAWVG